MLVPHVADPDQQPGWYRAVVMIPAGWLDQGLKLKLKGSHESDVWCNGQLLKSSPKASGKLTVWDVPASVVEADDWNLLVIKLARRRFAGRSASLGIRQEQDFDARSLAVSSWRRRFFQHAAARQIWWFARCHFHARRTTLDATSADANRRIHTRDRRTGLRRRRKYLCRQLRPAGNDRSRAPRRRG